MTEETKRCPFCGEEVLAIATLCKHCKSDLGAGAGAASALPVAPAADYGWFLLAIPAVAILLIWGWVSNMSLLQSPGSSLSLIMLVTVLGTATLAAVEASKLGMTSDRKAGSYGPVAWFFIIFLLWIVGYPVYLAKRKHYGVANRAVLGLLVALIFVGSYAVMNSAIEQKQNEVKASMEQMQQALQSEAPAN